MFENNDETTLKAIDSLIRIFKLRHTVVEEYSKDEEKVMTISRQIKVSASSQALLLFWALKGLEHEKARLTLQNLIGINKDA